MQKNELDSAKEQMPPSKIVELAAYPISVAIGGYVLYHAARRGAFDHLKNSKWLGDELQTALNEHIKKGAEVGLDGYKVIADFHKTFSEKISYRMNELGINNPLRLWNCNYHDQQIKRLVEGITAAGISLGAFLMASDHLKNKENELAQKVNDQIKEQEKHNKKYDSLSI